MVLTGACSDDDDAEPASTTQGFGLRARGVANLEGALIGTTQFEVQYTVSITSCADLAAADTFVVPLPSQLGDATLAWQAAVVDLHGAGEYTAADFGVVQVTVERPDVEPVVYAGGADLTASLDLATEGGGTFAFAGLRDPVGGELRGTSTWTCGPGA